MQHKCKHCGKLAKEHVMLSGRKKGWYRTCGSNECIKKGKSGNALPIPKERICELCKIKYDPTGWKQRWCKDCVPDKRWMAIAQRYGIGKVEWNQKLEKQKGKCALCLNDPKVVDHDHATDKIRGLLCYSCNLLISGLDMDALWVEKAKKYLQKYV